MKSTRWVITYVFVASLGLWGALFMSLKFMTPGHAQTPQAPSSGDLPPEFLDEPQIPQPATDGQIPPPPTQPPGEVPAQESEQIPELVPPPPPPGIPPASAPANGAPPMVPPDVAPGDPTQIPVDGVPIVPQFASDDQYNYDPTGRRDPFKPYRAYRPPPSKNTSTGVTATGPERIIDETDPLQRWDLDRFAIVAIMWEVRQPKAMVRDPDGKMYMIGKSTKIGRNSGQVVTIREGEVVVVEQIDNEGVQTKEVKVLELKK